MLRFGPQTGAVVLAAMPPFEEANRLRAFFVTLLRALGEHGIGAAIPDMPGQGDSPLSTAAARLDDWRDAFAACEAKLSREGARVHIAAMRGGALYEGRANCQSRWHFSPLTGAALVREMVRARQAAAKEAGEPFDPASVTVDGPPVELAGNLIAPAMLADLQGAVPVAGQDLRTLRLETDAAAADRKILARPLWRRAEPDNNPALARELAADLAEWVRACGS